MTNKILKKEDLNNLSFEDSLKELEKIVEELDSGTMDLEKAVEAYEIGTKLKKEVRITNIQCIKNVFKDNSF